MVLDLVLKAIFSLIDLLKGSLFLAIIAFAAVFVASFLHAWLSKRFGLSWLKATMVTSYLLIFLLIMLLYCAPIVSGFGETDLGAVPDNYKMTAFDWAAFVAAIALRNSAIALLFTFFLLPLEFLSGMVFDFAKEKYKLNKWVNIFIAVFASCLATAIICLYLLPWIVPGLLYLTFYWHL